MKLHAADIRKASSELLKAIKKENIETARDLERMIGKIIKVDEKDHIEFLKRPSNYGTKAYTTSYVREGAGIPLEFKVNTVLNYSQIILKAEKMIELYQEWGTDPYGNMMQYRIIKPAHINLIKEELTRLNSIKTH